MSNIIKIKRGQKNNLANAGVVDGELKYTKDTQEFFIGDGTNNVQIGGNPTDFPISTATQTALDAKQNTISDLGYIRNQAAKVNDKISGIDITDSGDSLPSATLYSLNDTFLNKTNAKLYTTLAPAYKVNDNVTNTNITIDLTTGLATGFNEGTYYKSNYMYRSTSDTYNWTGNNSHIYFHFSMNSVTDNGSGYMWGVTGSGSYCLYIRYNTIEHVFYFNYFKYTGGVWYGYFDYKLFSTQPEINTEYYIHLAKNGNECIATLSLTGYDVDIIETGTIPTKDITISSANMMLGSNQSRYGVCKNMSVYLLDTSGEFLVPDGALTWDSGTTLEDNTQYNDTTNEKTIYYNNNIIYEDGSGLPDQSGQSGKYLTTNGTTMSWAEVGSGGTSDYNDLTNKPSINSVTLSGNKTGSDLGLVDESDLEEIDINNLMPSQSGNSGKFLSTNGSSVYWASTGGGGSGYVPMPTVTTLTNTTYTLTVAENTIYKFSNAITSLTISSITISDLESLIYFTTGSSITFVDNSTLKWGGGSIPSLDTNTTYCIAIKNGLAELDKFGR